MVSEQKAIRPVSEQIEIGQLIQSSSGNDDVNWSSGYEMDCESDPDLIDAGQEVYSEARLWY